MSAVFEQPVRVRYSECDGQGVVFNAWYLAYCDDAFEAFLRSGLGRDCKETGWHFMVKRVSIEWSGSARTFDELVTTVEVTRIGRSSFDVRFRGCVADRPVFVAEHVYVGVATGTQTPIPPPDEVRACLEGVLV